MSGFQPSSVLFILYLGLRPRLVCCRAFGPQVQRQKQQQQHIPFVDDKQERNGLLGSALRQQHFDQQQTSSAHDSGVGDVEVGPVVAVDVDLEKIDDVAEP